MKRFFLYLMFCALVFVAKAQDNRVGSIEKENEKSWSARFNGDLLRIGDSPEDLYDGDFGFNAGVAYRIPLGSRFFVEPSVYGFYNRFAPGIEVEGENLSGSVWYARAMEAGFRGIVSVGYVCRSRESSSFSVALGPLLNYPVVGRVSDPKPKGTMKYELSHDLFSHDTPFPMKRFNLGINLQIVWQLNRMELILSNSKGLLNLSDIRVEGYDHRVDQNNLCLGLGYRF